MLNNVRAEIYTKEGLYVPNQWGKEFMHGGYPVGGDKSGQYLYYNENEVENGKLIYDKKEYPFRRLISVCFWQKRLNTNQTEAAFGIIIPAEREAEFLSFIGMAKEEIPTFPAVKEIKMALDGRYEHGIGYKNINTMFYNGKEYKI